MAFKFNAYKFKIDEEFKTCEFTKMSELVGKTIVIDVVKFYTENSDGKDKTACRFSYTIEGDDTARFSYTKSYGIVSVLQNIMDSEGVIPKIPVKIRTIMTSTGNAGYVFEDVE